MSRRADRPNPDWIRGVCPDCGGLLVSNYYYQGGKGYICVWECWDSLGEHPCCQYREFV